MNIQERLTRARIQLLLDFPFYGNLVVHLPLKEERGVPTFATDGRCILYNPDFAHSLSDRDLQFILAHEVVHNVLYHLTRTGERNKERWNFAIDYATNAILYVDFGFVPKDILYDQKYENMTAEEIYNKLPDMNGKAQKQSGYSRHSNEGTTIEIDKEGNIKVDGKPIKQYDEHKQIQGSKSELDEMEKEWKVQVAKAWQQSKIAGKVPGGMKIFIEQLLEPKLDWRNMMKQFVISNAKSDFKFLPPNKRYVHQDMYMPSLEDESLGTIAFVIDNSGSTIEYQQRFFSECNGLLQQYDVEMHLIVCDTKVQSHHIYNKGDRIELKHTGGGGTELSEAWKFMDSKGIQPEVVVCLTDGYTSFDFKSRYPVLWVLTKDSIGLDKIPFGLKVRMNE